MRERGFGNRVIPGIFLGQGTGTFFFCFDIKQGDREKECRATLGWSGKESSFPDCLSIAQRILYADNRIITGTGLSNDLNKEARSEVKSILALFFGKNFHLTQGCQDNLLK